VAEAASSVTVVAASAATASLTRPPTELRDDFAVGNQLEILRRMESLLGQLTTDASRPDDR
jgi:hypothetical protein